MKKWLMMTVVLAGLGGLASAGLVNPSFEEPVIPSGDELYQDPTGWTNVGGTPYISKVVTPPDGDQYVDLGNGTFLYQISDITMETGKTYTATVYGKCDREMAGDNVFLSLVAGDYTTIVASDAVHSDTDTWVLLTASYLCTEEQNGQLAGVRLGGSAASWCWEGYDMATLTPEPTTMVLLAVGGAVLLRKRR